MPADTLFDTRYFLRPHRADDRARTPRGLEMTLNTGDVPPDALRFGHGTQAHARFHNEYATLMAVGTVEGLLAAMPDRCTFVLSRAGSPGIQRYAADWRGDNRSRWEHLWTLQAHLGTAR